MKLNYKRSLKFITLMISALFIAMVSAQVYKYMYIDGSITVGSPKMVWILGDDAPSDAAIDGSTVTVDLDVQQGIPVNFTECLFLKNANTTGSFNILISITTAVSGTDFTEAKMHIYTNSTGSWVFVNTMDLTNAADTYSGSLAAGKYLRMTFEVDATTSASGTKPFDIQVRYE
jgi:hypothetical protein